MVNKSALTFRLFPARKYDVPGGSDQDENLADLIDRCCSQDRCSSFDRTLEQRRDDLALKQDK